MPFFVSLPFFNNLLFGYVCKHLCVSMCTVCMQEPPRSADSVRSSETGVMGVLTCNGGAGNRTQLFCRTRKCSEALRHLSGPFTTSVSGSSPPGQSPGRSCFEIPYSQLHTEVNASDNILRPRSASVLLHLLSPETGYSTRLGPICHLHIPSSRTEYSNKANKSHHCV